MGEAGGPHQDAPSSLPRPACFAVSQGGTSGPPFPSPSLSVAAWKQPVSLDPCLLCGPPGQASEGGRPSGLGLPTHPSPRGFRVTPRICPGEELAQWDWLGGGKGGSAWHLQSHLHAGPALPCWPAGTMRVGVGHFVYQHAFKCQGQGLHTVGTQQVCRVTARISMRRHSDQTPKWVCVFSFIYMTATRNGKGRQQTGGLRVPPARVGVWACARATPSPGPPAPHRAHAPASA